MRENPKPLEQVLTFAEATKRWGLGHSTLREAAKHSRFLPGEIRKSGGTWLVTEKAMRRLYGEPKGGEKMKRITIKYLPENCPARDGLMCEAHPDYPELRCHIDIDPARPCEFVQVDVKE